MTASTLGLLPKVSVKKGREYQLLRGHPWLFSGGISQASTKLGPGSLVDLIDVGGNFVARGYYNPNCDIAVRVLSTDPRESIDAQFFQKRLEQALALRLQFIDEHATNAFRLVNAEGDFLPGFIVDVYNEVAVVQCHTAGADFLYPLLLEALKTVLKPKGIVLRNDVQARKREGLELSAPQIVSGTVDDELLVKENTFSFAVSPLKGQKTGFFTDQRDKRAAIYRYCSIVQGEVKMLNCFSYTGSFSVYAAAANHEICSTNVDESEQALEIAKKNFKLNGMLASQHDFICADAFKWLDQQVAIGNSFDIVVLDPPAFAKSHKDKQKALKGYFRLAKQGIQLCRPGALLVMCSCSGAISMPEFVDTIKDAAVESGRHLQIAETYIHGADHPINIAAPEGAYLKALFCRII